MILLHPRLSCMYVYICIYIHKKQFCFQWPTNLPNGNMHRLTCQLEKDNMQRSLQVQRSGSTHEFGQLFKIDLSNTV